jgi:hypothetical protein
MNNSGNNTLVGGAGNNTIRSRSTFSGSRGDDLLQASDAWFGDTYLFQIGDGKDDINDLGYMGTDSIVFVVVSMPICFGFEHQEPILK